jgi:hypothetical protein
MNSFLLYIESIATSDIPIELLTAAKRPGVTIWLFTPNFAALA